MGRLVVCETATFTDAINCVEEHVVAQHASVDDLPCKAVALSEYQAYIREA